MTLRSSIIDDRVPEYELAGDDVLRPLDPTEHNLERLNAHARGSSRVYFTLTIEGPLAHGRFERALDALTDRHPLLRVRVVRARGGALCFAPTRGDRADGTARIPVSYLRLDELGAWPSLVEADMNAGAIASGRGPLFALALLEPTGLADGASGRRVIVMIGHHAVTDATSGIALLRELLEQLAVPSSRPALAERVFYDPFCLDEPLPELGELEVELGNTLAEQAPRERSRRLADLHARLERCEARLHAKQDADRRFPAALKAVHAWLSAVSSERAQAAGVLPEVDLGTSGARYGRAGTLLLHRSLTRERTRALLAVTKEQQLTLHAPLSAAVAIAQAARHADLSESAAGSTPEQFALAAAVNLRNQFVPPLEPGDVRMATDVVISRFPVTAGEQFWQLARCIGQDVTRAVGGGRALSSWFRTERRDFGTPPPGVPLPLISNVGRVSFASEYGSLRVHDLSVAMVTHGSFQIAALFLTFDDRLFVNFYAESPSVSRASLERFAARALALLDEVSQGSDPPIARTLAGTGRPSPFPG